MSQTTIVLGIAFFLNTYLVAQDKTEKITLNNQLKEISGLETYRDSLLVAINDSGNEPFIYFLTKKGIIAHRCKVSNHPNIDWEDLSVDDKGNLYIADVGNNSGVRKEFQILKLSLDEAFINSEVEAQEIRFVYSESKIKQNSESTFNRNCEALIWWQGRLYLFIKNTKKGPKRKVEIYSLSDAIGSYSAEYSGELQIKGNRGPRNVISAADFFDGKLYVLTYKEILIYTFSNKQWILINRKKLHSPEQYEAIEVQGKKTIFVASEKNKILGGPNLYIFEND